MENIIIIAILVITVLFGVRETVKHFKREGGCCGGGSSYKPRKKKLSKVIYKKSFRVEGMHCEHCKRRVEEVINDMKGLSGKVNLKKGELVVSYEEDVADEMIRQRVEKAGYTVS